MRGRQNGSALLLTLWCVGVLGLSLFLIVQMMEGDVDEERFESMRVEARQLALTGVAIASNPAIERGDELLTQRLPGDRTLEVTITSENARMNINRALETPANPVLRALFARWEVPDRSLGLVVDSLTDWVDEDDLRSLHGAERDDLIDQSRYSIPQNRPFVSVREMERVRGMDLVAGVKPEWPEYFSVHSGAKFDVHDAPLDWLVVAGGMSRSMAEQWIELRAGLDKIPNTEDDVRLGNLGELRTLLGMSELQFGVLQANFDVNSNIRRISSLATVGNVSYRITVVSRESEEGGIPLYLMWEEE